MNFEKRDPTLILLTSSGGLVSALITLGASYPLGHFAVSQGNRLVDFSQIFFPGTVFGVLLSASFALRGYLRELWKAITLTVVSAAAYCFSFWAAAGISLHPFGLVPPDRIGEVTDLALVGGGLTGGFCTICAASLLFNSSHTWQRRILKALCWTPVGALLAVVGWTLGPSLGIALWQIIHSMNLTAPTETVRNAQGDQSHMFSLWAIWQAGMGLVLGLVVNSNQSTGEELKQRESSRITSLMG
jgi:hypothetical protein